MSKGSELFLGPDVGKAFLTITPDGKIRLGEGLSQQEATQSAARMLAAQFSGIVQAAWERGYMSGLRVGLDQAEKASSALQEEKP